jgi:TonB-linked SusC/RagA family outer membrane protein
MKKFRDYHERIFGFLSKKTIRVMKLTFFLSMVTIFQLWANNSYSQMTKLTLKLENVKISDALKEIENQSEFYFLYSPKLINVERKVNIDAEEESIKDILTNIFDEKVKFIVYDKQIILIPSDLTFPSSALQQLKIIGKVTDEKGNPLPGVTILIKGTTLGALTDISGQYSINNVSRNATLIFSFVGMITQEIPINENNKIDVVLKETSVGLDEVVVVGYGTQRKKDLTGSISSIKTEEIQKSVNTSIDQGLSGRVPGLIAIQSSGQPGADVSVQIRGNASFASAGVLYVVDGVPVNGGANEPASGNLYGGIDRSPLNFINPNDIESIEVLKDASSAAIYGARAGAGVILITTKRGKTGEARVNYNFSYAFQEPAKFYDVLNEHDYMVVRNYITKENWMNVNNIAPYGTTDPSTLPAFVPKYTQTEIDNAGKGESAVNAITQPGSLQQHNISISGGTAKTKYYASGNFLDQDGVIKTSNYKKYSGRFNLDQMVGNKFNIGINVTGSREESDNPAIGTSEFQNAGIILSAIYQPPTVPLVAADGSYPLNPDYPNVPNPVSFLTTTDNTVLNRLMTNVFAEWEIIKDLKAKANFSYDQSSSKRNTYLPKSFLYGAIAGGQANVAENTADIGLLEYTLSYSKNINNTHHLNGMAGYSYQVLSGDGFNAGNQQFLTDNFLYNNLAVGEYAKPPVGSTKYAQIWASYFGRLNYDYLDKYLLQASIRRDGSSNFAENKKYGWFPSVSAAWKLSSESFMENVKAISFLKLRGSYGTTGNSNIGGNAFAYYSAGSNYVFGNTQLVGVYQSQLANPDLSWETAKEINFGLDLGLFKDRITGTFEVFNKVISDLLSTRPLPSFFVVNSVAANIGKTQSSGFEISLKTTNIDEKNFVWKTEFNIGHFKDIWKERDPLVVKTLPKYVGLNDPIRAIYGYETDGILQVGEQAPAAMPGLKPGMIKVKDLNGYDANGNLTGKPDGMLNSADEVYLGNSDPGYTFGFGNTFQYKNFDLNIFMYGMLDRLKYNQDKITAYDLWNQMGLFGWNALSLVKDHWSIDNPSSTNPSGLNNPYSGYTSNYYSEKASFLRCRNITLGYTFSKNMIARQNLIQGIRVYADIQNVFTITPYSGLDPELSGFVDYPLQRSYILGINVTF